MASHNFSIGSYSRRYNNTAASFTPKSVPGGFMWLNGADPTGTGASIQPGLLTSWTDSFWGCNLQAYWWSTPTAYVASTISYAGNFFTFNGNASYANIFAGNTPTYTTGCNFSIFTVSYMTSISQVNGRVLGLSVDSNTSDNSVVGGVAASLAIRRYGACNNGTAYQIMTCNSATTAGCALQSLSRNELFIGFMNGGGLSSIAFPGWNSSLPVSTFTTVSTSVSYTTPVMNIRYMSLGANTLVTGGNPASFFNGNISEVIIYSTIVSTSDYSNLQKYLINKWNIQ